MTTVSEESQQEGAEGRGAFGGFIGPRTLIANVRVAAPYLFDGTHPRAAEGAVAGAGARAPCERAAASPLGWWHLLRDPRGIEALAEPTSAARADYFALCLAAHHATVATYVPTDVDAKIRHALWFEQEDEAQHARMRALARVHGGWELAGFSARLVAVPDDLGGGTVSGHDGEHLSVWCGAMLSSYHFGWVEAAREFEAMVGAELERQARVFLGLARRRGAEVDTLRVAAALTHNAGDVNQALAIADAPARALRGPRGAGVEGARVRARFGELAQRDPSRFGGAFARAGLLYRELLATEGHRNYPLRQAKVLRAHPDLLLPIAPFLDAWGERLARWPAWDEAQRAEAVGALIDGCHRVASQVGYYRALSGLARELPGGFDRLAPALRAAQRRALRDSELRQRIAIPRLSFESSLGKATRRLLDG